jgi:hypothetical protein
VASGPTVDSGVNSSIAGLRKTPGPRLWPRCSPPSLPSLLQASLPASAALTAPPLPPSITLPMAASTWTSPLLALAPLLAVSWRHSMKSRSFGQGARAYASQ